LNQFNLDNSNFTYSFDNHQNISKIDGLNFNNGFGMQELVKLNVLCIAQCGDKTYPNNGSDVFNNASCLKCSSKDLKNCIDCNSNT